MSDAFLGEIRLMSFATAPSGWAQCNGQLLVIAQNQALFSLLGTTYGGNGTVTFGLPDLRGRVPIHVGAKHPLGEKGGAADHTLLASELPAHTHKVKASSLAKGGSASPSNNYLGGGNNVYGNVAATTSFSPETVAMAGGSQPHLNMQPFLTLSFCIALQGPTPPH